MHVIEAAITDLRSAKAVINLLRHKDPHLVEIKVPTNVYLKISKELFGKSFRIVDLDFNETVDLDFNEAVGRVISIFGVRVTTK